MSNGGLPDEVRQFIRQNITSIEQLEILIHLYYISPKAETSEAISSALYLSAESTARQLTHYSEKHIINSANDGKSYYIANKEAPIAKQIGNLATSYRERRVSVINEIYSNPISTLQSFADAFIIGKKKE